MTDEIEFNYAFSNKTYIISGKDPEMSLKPLPNCPTEAFENSLKAKDGKTISSYYQDLGVERLPRIYQTIGKNELQTKPKKESTCLRARLANGECDYDEATFVEGTLTANGGPHPPPTRNHVARGMQPNGSLKHNHFYEKERHQSSRALLCIMSAVLIFAMVSFVLVILLILGILGTQCACTHHYPSAVSGPALRKSSQLMIEMQRNLSMLEKKIRNVSERAYGQIAGERGFNGSQGQQGPPGAQGPVGPQGPMGLQGPKGVQGLPGPEGPQGPKGLRGIQGPEGFNGSQGLPGAPGAAGTPGAMGLQGPRGFNGSQGMPGPTGKSGATFLKNCTLKEKRSSYIAKSAVPLYQDVVYHVKDGVKLIGAVCSSDGMSEYKFQKGIDRGKEYYKCSCAGVSKGPLTNDPKTNVACIMYYWECPTTV